MIMLSAKEIEEQIEDYALKFIPVRDPRVEWETPFPMFVDTFNLILTETNRIPSQDEFVYRYFQDNKAQLSRLTDSMRRGLEARIRRTYPSFVRDVHFGALLRERGLDVSYDREMDVCAGVDQVIRYRGLKFYIHCYVNTRIGRMGRKIKNRRHDFRGIHLDIEMDLGAESAKSVGDFYLYSEDHIDYLVELMNAESEHEK